MCGVLTQRGGRRGWKSASLPPTSRRMAWMAANMVPLRRSGAKSVPLRIGRPDRDVHVEVADHHLLERLFAPAHQLVRVGVVRVALRVVEMGQAIDAGALGQVHRFREDVVGLPAEVVGRDREHDLGRLARPGDRELEILAPQVHVRQQAQESRIRSERPGTTRRPRCRSAPAAAGPDWRCRS